MRFQVTTGDLLYTVDFWSLDADRYPALYQSICVWLQSAHGHVGYPVFHSVRDAPNTLATSFPSVPDATGSPRLHDRPAARNTGPLEWHYHLSTVTL